MKRRVFIGFAFTMLLCGLIPLQARTEGKPGVHSPSPGSPERQAVLDGLRAWVHRRLGLDVLFVVQAVNVQDGWAWVEATPRSRDGRNRYEAISALLRKGNGCWAVVTVLSGECTTADDPDRACETAYRRFRQSVTGSPLFVPSSLFP